MRHDIKHLFFIINNVNLDWNLKQIKKCSKYELKNIADSFILIIFKMKGFARKAGDQNRLFRISIAFEIDFLF